MWIGVQIAPNVSAADLALRAPLLQHLARFTPTEMQIIFEATTGVRVLKYQLDRLPELFVRVMRHYLPGGAGLGVAVTSEEFCAYARTHLKAIALRHDRSEYHTVRLTIAEFATVYMQSSAAA